jgi:hypothetical protein
LNIAWTPNEKIEIKNWSIACWRNDNKRKFKKNKYQMVLNWCVVRHSSLSQWKKGSLINLTCILTWILVGM